MTPEERAREILIYAQRDGRDMLGRVATHIAAAVAEEREACAKIADDTAKHDQAMADLYEHDGLKGPAALREVMVVTAVEIAAAIRQRGEGG